MRPGAGDRGNQPVSSVGLDTGGVTSCCGGRHEDEPQEPVQALPGERSGVRERGWASPWHAQAHSDAGSRQPASVAGLRP